MPLQSSQFWDDDAKIVTRLFIWPTATGQVENYPANFDDKWRVVHECSVLFEKQAAGGSNALLFLIREGILTPHTIWARRMDGADLTVGPAALQGTEVQGTQTQYLQTSAQILPVPLIMPPRSQLQVSTATGNLSTFISGVIHEADDLSLLLPVI